MTMECMGRQALACFVGTILARLSGEHKGHFYSTSPVKRNNSHFLRLCRALAQLAPLRCVKKHSTQLKNMVNTLL